VEISLELLSKLYPDNKKTTHILHYENEEQLGFKNACKAYRNGIRSLCIGSDALDEKNCRSLRLFIVRRGLLILYNLACDNFRSLLQLTCAAIKKTFDTCIARPLGYISNRLDLLGFARKRGLRVIKFALPGYLEDKFGKEVKEFINSVEYPVLDSSEFIRGKVQLFIGSLGPGGAERQFVNTVLGLADKKDMVVTCQHYHTPAERHFGHLLENRGISVNQLDPSDVAFTNLASCNLSKMTPLLEKEFFSNESPFGRSLIPYLNEIIKHKPEVVHAWLDYVNIRAGLAALLAGVPRIILSQRSVAPDNFDLYTIEMKSIYKVLLQSQNVVLLNNSINGRADYCRWLNIRPEKIRVIYNGIMFMETTTDDLDSSKFRERYKIPHNAPLIGTIIRFSEEKRPLFWLRHAKEVLKRCPSAYFMLIGDGVLLQESIAFARKLEIDHRVIFTGIMNKTSLALKAMDVFVLSSRLEGLPNVLIEAQYIGVPVVIAEAGGAGETFKEGVSGYTIKRATPDKMAMKVVHILQNQPWRETARIEGPRFATEKFNIEKMIREIGSLYD